MPGPVAAGAIPAPLFFDGVIEGASGPITVKTGLTLLREEAERLSYEDYSSACGIPVETITGLASEFTSHGRKAAVNSHGGMMSGSGFYNAFALMMLNTLIGNLNWKGGTIMLGGWYPDTSGPAYDLSTVVDQVKPKGLPLGRNVPYEKTSEFKAKKGRGQSLSC